MDEIPEWLKVLQKLLKQQKDEEEGFDCKYHL
jgi:hypothetical protein